jgi:hypothetical protein
MRLVAEARQWIGLDGIEMSTLPVFGLDQQQAKTSKRTAGALASWAHAAYRW